MLTQTSYSPDGSVKTHHVTQREYYAFRFHIRQGTESPLHYGGRLFQEIDVDAYAQIEQSRLNYLRFNQDKLRAEVYQGLTDAIHDGTPLQAIGTRTVLPSSFSGGPRQMYQLYHDAMAICRSKGKPDLFITMTCNPRWPEITAALLPNQIAQDRPDLVAESFISR